MSNRMLLKVFFLLAFQGSISGYIEKSNPYIIGQLRNATFTLSANENAPLHTTVIHPQEAGEYPVYYFVPGGPEGVIPAEWYTDVLTRVVSHGFIVAAVDPFYPALSHFRRSHIEQDDLITKNLKHVTWLKRHLATYLNSTVKPLTHNLALGCHSAGCDVTLGMLQADGTVANSTIFMEPFSVRISKKPGIKVPAYMYGTQFAEEYGPFPCSLPGVDYKAFYDTWGCPKWTTEVANFGHCDILDKLWWETCHIGHFCKTVGDWSRVYPQYHEYVSGAISAFLIATLQNYTQAIQYIQNTELIPLKLLSHNHTVSC